MNDTNIDIIKRDVSEILVTHYTNMEKKSKVKKKKSLVRKTHQLYDKLGNIKFDKLYKKNWMFRKKNTMTRLKLDLVTNDLYKEI